MDGLKCFHIQLTCIPSFDFSSAKDLNLTLADSGSQATRLNEDDFDGMFGAWDDPSATNSVFEESENNYSFVANWVDDSRLNTLFFHNLTYKSDAPTDNYEDMFHCWSFKLGRDANIQARRVTADYTLLYKRLMTLAFTNKVFDTIEDLDNEWSRVPVEFRNAPENTMLGENLVTNDFAVDGSPGWNIVKPEVDAFLDNADNVGDWYTENSLEWRTAD